MEANFLTQIILPLTLFIVMLGMGLSLKLKDFFQLVQSPRPILVGLLCQMVVLPTVGYLLVTIFQLEKELALGFIILTLCPGGPASNVITYMFRQDTALSISLTSVVSFVAPFSIPVLTFVFMEMMAEGGQKFSLDIIPTIIQLLAITIVPVSIGMWLLSKFPKKAKAIEKPMVIFAVLLLFAVVTLIVINDWQNMTRYFVVTGTIAILLNFSAMVCGFLVASLFRLPSKQAVTISIETGIQNGALALFITGTILDNLTMTIPTVTYSLIMFYSGCLFAWLINGQWLKLLLKAKKSQS